MVDHVSTISSHSPNGANVTKKVAQSGPRSKTQGLCSLFQGYAAYPTFGQAFRFVGSDPSEWVCHCLPPPEPRTGLRVQFSPNPKPWTGPGSGSPGFRSEPRFRTGLRHHYPGGVNTPFLPPTVILDIAHTLLHGAVTHFHAPKPSGSTLLWPHRLDWLLGGVPVPVVRVYHGYTMGTNFHNHNCNCAHCTLNSYS